MEITATIDRKVKYVSEASIRRHPKLEDSNGISNLPTTEIFEQLALMGYVSNSDKLTFQKGHFSTQWSHTQKPFSNIRKASKGYTRVDIPLFSTMLVQGPILQGEGSTVPVESHHTPTSAPSTLQPPISSPSRRITRQESMVPQPISPTKTPVEDEAASTCVDVRHGGAATTVTSLDVGQGSGNIDKTPSMPHNSPVPRVNTLESDEGSMTLQELMILCTTLSKKVESLEEYLKQTKQVYGAAYTKLIRIVKSTASPPRVSTADDISTTETLVYIRRSETNDKEQLDEEERQRIARVHEEASSFNIEEWEAIQARVEADEELAHRTIPKIAAKSSKRDAEEELDQDSSKIQKTVLEQGMNVEALQTKYPIIDWKIYTKSTRKYWKIIRVGNHTKVYQFFDDLLKVFDKDDLVKLWSLVKERFTSTEPTNDKEREIWVELKRLFKPDIDEELWKLQKHIHDLT
ncbi:hypothetical protein Tco_0482571 [Tanacetum coccineum]